MNRITVFRRTQAMKAEVASLRQSNVMTGFTIKQGRMLSRPMALFRIRKDIADIRDTLSLLGSSSEVDRLLDELDWELLGLLSK